MCTFKEEAVDDFSAYSVWMQLLTVTVMMLKEQTGQTLLPMVSIATQQVQVSITTSLNSNRYVLVKYLLAISVLWAFYMCVIKHVCCDNSQIA